MTMTELRALRAKVEILQLQLEPAPGVLEFTHARRLLGRAVEEMNMGIARLERQRYPIVPVLRRADGTTVEYDDGTKVDR